MNLNMAVGVEGKAPSSGIEPVPYSPARSRAKVDEDTSSRVTDIVAGLSAGGGGDKPSAEELLPIVYDELRRLAARYLSGERPGHTLQPTALVHEAYIKLVDMTRVDWQGRTHFFAVGARVMRNLLIDHARGRGRAKRGGKLQRVTLAGNVQPFGGAELDLDRLLVVDEALQRLAELDERQARVVELRFFGGLTVPEVSQLLGVSQRTVEGDWTHARAWLLRELSRRDQ
jgi:RNA polymerase sigma-70 factor (ECF subfamily)